MSGITPPGQPKVIPAKDRTSLRVLLDRGSRPELEAALARGVHPESLVDKHWTMLHFLAAHFMCNATGKFRQDAMRLLVAHGASVNTRSRGEYAQGQVPDSTALTIAGQDITHQDAPASVRCLLALGADVTVRDRRGSGVLSRATDMPIDLVRELIDRGAPADVSYDNATPLMEALHDNKVEHIAELLRGGAAANRLENYATRFGEEWPAGVSPLAVAKSAAAVDLLVAHGADVHLRNRHQMTALHHAQAGAVRALLAHGAELEARDYMGRTPLLAAVDRNAEIDAIGALLDAGADTHARDARGLGLGDLVNNVAAARQDDLRQFLQSWRAQKAVEETLAAHTEISP